MVRGDDDDDDLREQNRAASHAEQAAIERITTSRLHGTEVPSGEVSRLLALYAVMEKPERTVPKRVQRARTHLAEE